MSIPGHSYTTQPASHPDYVPAPNTSYPPPQTQMTEEFMTNLIIMFQPVVTVLDAHEPHRFP